MIQAKHLYGMRLRGFSLGTYPTEGFIERRDAKPYAQQQYYDILVYDRLLTQEECDNYDLRYIGDVCSLSEEIVTRTNIVTMTNREWLNSLTDEEFIEVCGHNSLCNYIQDNYEDFCENNAVCDDCLKKWLSTELIERKEEEE